MERPEIESANVTLLGKFPIAQLRPSWFATHELLRSDEALTASIEVVLPDLVDWTAGWLRLQCTDDRLTLSSVAGTHWDPLPDLAASLLRLASTETVVRAVGLNRLMHFAAASEDSWHRIGDTLAPKEFWKRLLPGRPGMRSLSILTVLEKTERNLYGMQIRVKVEPSVRVTQGVFVDVNHHFDVKGHPEGTAADIVLREWNRAMSESLQLAQAVLDLGKEPH